MTRNDVLHAAVPTAPPPGADGRRSLAGVAATQHGCFTRAQARAAGLSTADVRARLRHGELVEAFQGVLVLTSTPPSFARDCSAALLSLPGGALTDRAAARLHGLDGFGGAPVELLVAAGGATRRDGLLLHRTKRFLPSEVTQVRGLQVTSLAWTLARLGAVLDDLRLEHALDDALRRGLREPELRHVLAALRRPGQPATARLQRMLDRPQRTGPQGDSWFERLVERALAAPGLPPAVPQHRVVVRGRVIARLDLAYPVVRVGVEAQSRTHHTTPNARRQDRLRISRLAEAGWEIVEWWWDDLADAAEAVALVRAACRRQAERLGLDPFHWLPLVDPAA